MNAFVLSQGEGKPGEVYHPAQIKKVDIPKINEGEVLVKIKAAALNHRSLSSDCVCILGADGVGVVVEPKSHHLYDQAVLIAPSVGWDSCAAGPDDPKQPFGILGSTKPTQGRGTFAEYIAVQEKYIVPCPAHLIGFWREAASFPLAGVTAYRAIFTKGQLQKGQNVLITGIGGGVAIQALQFAVAAGANVFVTSGTEGKIIKAKSLGAIAGVNYKDSNWPKEIEALLPKQRPFLDCVIDSAGGPIVAQVGKLMKEGGIIVCYGQTTGQPTPIGMAQVLRNIEYKGSTMGSLNEFKNAVDFIGKHSIQPIVHTVIPSLEKAEEAFKIMDEGSQFGKIVIVIDESGSSKL